MVLGSNQNTEYQKLNLFLPSGEELKRHSHSCVRWTEVISGDGMERKVRLREYAISSHMKRFISDSKIHTLIYS